MVSLYDAYGHFSIARLVYDALIAYSAITVVAIFVHTWKTRHN